MQELYRGYVPTKNKKCMMPFKNKSADELETYDAVKDLPEYAGILADEIVLIDIDDYEESEVLLDIVDDMQLNTKVTETTRGKHFYFINKYGHEYMLDKCGTHKRLACGITADIKVGCKNSYSVLKYDDKTRPVLYDIEDDEEYELLPKWLMPVSSKIDFISMTAGDGRNQSLFNYILTLQANDFSIDEVRECLRIINDYVLKDPLSDAELDTLMRDDAFQKPVFFKRNQFLFDKFATYLKNNNHIIKIHGQLHVYKDGIYVNGTKEIERQMIKQIPDLSRAKRSEVLSYLDVVVDSDEPMAAANHIAFKNGVYNLLTDEMEDFSPDLVITNKIPYDYYPEAYSEICDKTLDKLACQDKKIRMLLEECIGYCFYRRNELRKSIILTGEKENGKSTFLSMLETLLGQENITSLDLKELGERFKTAQLFGKLANIGDDIGDEFIPNPAIFKKLSSGNPVNAEFKGADPFDFSSYAKLIFSANDIPRIKDKSGAVISRLVIIPFNARFSANDPDFDPYIKYKLIVPEVMEYLIVLGIKGLKRILANQQFTVSTKVQKALTEYEVNNNPILLFFQDDPKIYNEPTQKVYQEYYSFCVMNNYTPMSNIEFSKQAKKYFGATITNKMVNGKRYRVFEKEVIEDE